MGHPQTEGGRAHKVSNIYQLRDVVMEEWKRTPVATCEALVNSMPKRWWKIMVATQNIDAFGPILTFSLRGVLRFRNEWLCVELF